ncbi:hypothetical protein GUJ93_ZPchr0005g14626 [Zizania palustris]|uniref:Uncharacterized protein n=1 Tax=Zizania palustris TaxID=103762 RepID=A0A8J5SG95_ZIZPA|nr:hypothetical protein GUJ93_ZPchr0005g14626 [Zizania palustris]
MPDLSVVCITKSPKEYLQIKNKTDADEGGSTWKQVVQKDTSVCISLNDFFKASSPLERTILLAPKQVSIAGVEADTRMEETKVMIDTWILTWDHEMEFPLSAPKLALLWVEMHKSDNHQKDDFTGQTCMPVWELR